MVYLLQPDMRDCIVVVGSSGKKEEPTQNEENSLKAEECS